MNRLKTLVCLSDGTQLLSQYRQSVVGTGSSIQSYVPCEVSKVSFLDIWLLKRLKRRATAIYGTFPIRWTSRRAFRL